MIEKDKELLGKYAIIYKEGFPFDGRKCKIIGFLGKFGKKKIKKKEEITIPIVEIELLGQNFKIRGDHLSLTKE